MTNKSYKNNYENAKIKFRIAHDTYIPICMFKYANNMYVYVYVYMYKCMYINTITLNCTSLTMPYI